MTEFVFEAGDERDTDRFGAALAAALAPRTTIALCGTLGAGKTRLVQALAAACGVPREEVVSPTFVLCQQYHAVRPINHLDAYRIKSESEFRDLGIDEMLASDAITIIEWADRIPNMLPEDHLRIDIEVTGPTSRRFALRALGARHESIHAALSSHLSTQY
jgi:tRNA threonylcarbamoyladenosine biosynthesis protein TsaE